MRILPSAAVCPLYLCVSEGKQRLLKSFPLYDNKLTVWFNYDEEREIIKCSLGDFFVSCCFE